MVQTVGYADQYSLPIPHSCHYCGTNPGFDFLLVSLTWFKPRERLSLANRWMCQYPYDKNTGVRTMVQTGGKVTCRNRGVRYNHVSQPRGVRYNRWLNPVGRRPPRVAIAGSNRGFSRLTWSAEPTVPVACSRCSRGGGAFLLSTAR